MQVGDRQLHLEHLGVERLLSQALPGKALGLLDRGQRRALAPKDWSGDGVEDMAESIPLKGRVGRHKVTCDRHQRNGYRLDDSDKGKRVAPLGTARNILAAVLPFCQESGSS